MEVLWKIMFSALPKKKNSQIKYTWDLHHFIEMQAIYV